MNEQEIFESLKKILVKSFDLKAESITLDARLYEDLKLDSIDAVDLIVNLKPILPRNIDPQTFKEVRTLQDVVSAVHSLLQEEQH